MLCFITGESALCARRKRAKTMRGKGQERIAQYQRLDFSDTAHIMGFEGTTPRAD